MRLEYLADHPPLVPELARLHFEEWGHLRPEETLEARTSRLRGYCGRASIPTVVVALEADVLCGSAMLIEHEMVDEPTFGPWLDGVYVAPSFRGRGLGSALVERMVAEAKALGVAALYLYTSDAQSLYSRLGWTVIETRRHRGETVSVMSIRLISA
jgi:GNAT superfamily N-acetyltransferase